MNTVAIIHARGGSKRIPLKNIKLLNGKPLVAYIIEAAVSAKTVDRVIVSTDHPEIIRVSKEYGAEVPFIRPDDISEDVPSEYVTQHAVTYLEEKADYPVRIAVTMQPTTPFCTPDDIDGCVETLRTTNADCCLSACEIHEHPQWMFSIDSDGNARHFLDMEMAGEIGVSQTLPKLYIPNGGIYATRKESLFRYDSIFGKKIRLWIMSRERSIDIDEPIDFMYAEFMAKHYFSGD